MTRDVPHRVVLGNAELSVQERELLGAIVKQAGSTIFTANAGFNSELTRWDWSRRVAVIQDYVFQDLNQMTKTELVSSSTYSDSVILVESTFEGATPETYKFHRTQVLTHMSQRRLLNKVARGRFFRIYHEYLPSTGIIALALALRETKDPFEPVALLGVGLSTSDMYVARPETRDPAIFKKVLELPPLPRQHYRPDALAIAAFSFHHHIVSLRPEVSALTQTWSAATPEQADDPERRPRSTFSAILQKMRQRELKFLSRKIYLQLSHLRIPSTQVDNSRMSVRQASDAHKK